MFYLRLYEKMDANLNADVRDRLGSTVAVTDKDGNMLQATGYYPSGTPYQIPDATLATEVDAKTDRLHIGNRWIGHKGLDLYDNTARMHDPLLARFHTVDPLWSDYPSHSPWSHCAANPLNFIDPTGNKIVDPFNLTEKYIDELNLMKEGLSNFNIEGKSELIDFCNTQLNQIDVLKKSQNIYELSYTDQDYGYTSVNANNGNILIKIPSQAVGKQQLTFIGHELEHGYQFEKGRLSIYPEGSNRIPTLYDMTDEIEAFRTMNIMQNGILYFSCPNALSDIKTPVLNGEPRKFPNRWTEEVIREIGGLYKNIPNKDIRIKGKKDPILKELQKNNEFYNRYKYGN